MLSVYLAADSEYCEVRRGQNIDISSAGPALGDKTPTRTDCGSPCHRLQWFSVVGSGHTGNVSQVSRQRASNAENISTIDTILNCHKQNEDSQNYKENFRTKL